MTEPSEAAWLRFGALALAAEERLLAKRQEAAHEPARPHAHRPLAA